MTGTGKSPIERRFCPVFKATPRKSWQNSSSEIAWRLYRARRISRVFISIPGMRLIEIRSGDLCAAIARARTGAYVDISSLVTHPPQQFHGCVNSGLICIVGLLNNIEIPTASRLHALQEYLLRASAQFISDAMAKIWHGNIELVIAMACVQTQSFTLQFALVLATWCLLVKRFAWHNALCTKLAWDSPSSSTPSWDADQSFCTEVHWMTSAAR